MQSVDIVPGKAHALRPPAAPEASLVKVQVLLPPRRGKVRIRYLTGVEEGLEEWVPTRQLTCLWEERKAFLRDEGREAALRKVSEEARDPVEEDAISNVLTATGEETGFQRSWTLPVAKAERLWRRAGLTGEPTREPYAYVDRHGLLHLPYLAALKFAKAFAAAEPEPCDTYMREWEERLRAEGYVPGDSYAHGLLREFEAGFALVRYWMNEPVNNSLETELQRVTYIAGEAIRELEAAGQEKTARRLKRQLRGQ
jgi:hypothetical protein